KSTWPVITSTWSPPTHGRYRLRSTGSNFVWPHVAPEPIASLPEALVRRRPPVGSFDPVDPGELYTSIPAASSWTVRKIVLSFAAEVAPLSTAYHCRSCAGSVAIGFFLHVFPPSFETATPRFARPSRSTKQANPWSSVTMSVSPPPGGASGLWVEEVRWNESPPSVERWTKLSCVDVPHGPDSQ